ESGRRRDGMCDSFVSKRVFERGGPDLAKRIHGGANSWLTVQLDAEFAASDGDASIADVVSGCNGAFGGESDQAIDEIFLRVEVNPRRRAGDDTVNRFCILGRGNFAAMGLFIETRTRESAIEEDDRVALVLKGHAECAIRVFENSENAENRRGINRAAKSFVIEAYVAAGDGRVEGAAGFSDAINCLAELAHHFGLFGIAEVE